MTNITNITLTMNDGTVKNINVTDDTVLVLGRCAKIKMVEDCSVKELLTNAKGEITTEVKSELAPIPFDEKLKAANEELQNSKETSYFNSAVDFLSGLSADEFLELVIFANEHGNRFPKFSAAEIRECVNADDAYCSALIGLSRPCGERVENAAFKLLADCIDAEPYAPVFDTFKRMWDSLKCIRALTGHQLTSLTIE